ncbi:MAG: DUF3500 domain-containing protein [Akkermansiaceae bacterium]|nr:DUF3500 domain-containing protein [Akkermansiaceae bacterium]
MKMILSFLAAGSMSLMGGPAKDMETAARALIQAVSEEQKKDLLAAMDDEQRQNFRYTPRERSGLLFKELDEDQREAVFGLLKSAMSKEGLLKSKQIMMLEGVLAKLENRFDFRDPEKYWVAIFGTPGDAKGWGWKFEGHHLSLNFAIVGDQVALTPSFFGSNPAHVREGEHEGLQVLEREELAARDLALRVDARLRREAAPEKLSQQEGVIYTDRPPAEILTREKRKVGPLKPVGLSAAKMTKGEQAMLVELLKVYLERYRPELAKGELAAIEKKGIEKLHFGWAGSTLPGEAWYYRVQGPTFLMEAANSQNDANHVHAVWRKFDGDFGRDLLGEHFRDHQH